MTAQAQKLPWHRPQIVDLGIFVRPKDNKWPTFLKIISEQSAKRQTIPIVFPKVEIAPKKKLDGKLRSRKGRALKKTRRDTNGDFWLPFPLSLVNAVADDMEHDQGNEHITDLKWRRMVALVISNLVRPALEK